MDEGSFFIFLFLKLDFNFKTQCSDAWKDGGQEEMGATEERWLDGIIHSMDMNLSKLQEMVKDKKACRAAVHGVEKSWTRLSDWTTITKMFLLESPT